MEWENEEGRMETLTLRTGDVIENKPGRKHRATAIEDVRLMEVSTPELDDVVRLEDDFRRESTSKP
jgi:quercetin dioxygenase-like cupin family protein